MHVIQKLEIKMDKFGHIGIEQDFLKGAEKCKKEADLCYLSQ